VTCVRKRGNTCLPLPLLPVSCLCIACFSPVCWADSTVWPFFLFTIAGIAACLSLFQSLPCLRAFRGSTLCLCLLFSPACRAFRHHGRARAVRTARNGDWRALYFLVPMSSKCRDLQSYKTIYLHASAGRAPFRGLACTTLAWPAPFMQCYRLLA